MRMVSCSRAPDRNRSALRLYRTVKFASDQAAQQGNQTAALLLCANRDAQELLDSRLLEMPHQNAALAKLGREICAAVAAMAREHEVSHRWQNLKTEFGERAGQRLPARHDASARIVKPGIVLDRGNRS